ncbi:MAG: TIM barrel protein, partial [bacterium]|nr:TIM barrel protein [bacterium]
MQRLQNTLRQHAHVVQDRRCGEHDREAKLYQTIIDQTKRGAIMNKNSIGIMAPLEAEKDSLQLVKDFGLTACQLVSWKPERWTDDAAAKVRDEIQRLDVNVTAFWAGWSGPKVWNFLEGPETLGIVPDTYREMRVQCLKNAGSFAKKVGLKAIVTHLGFLPENPSDPKFEAVCEAVKDVADYL